MTIPSKVKFIDDELEKAFNSLSKYYDKNK